MRQIFGKLAGMAIAAAVSAIPSAAQARPHVQIDVGPVIVDPNCQPEPIHHETRVWVEPIYRTVTERQWVEPVYQTVTDHVWVPDSTKQENLHVWVPDRYEVRDVVHHEWSRRVIRQETVLVEAGHYEDRPGPLVVVPAHYEDVPRQQLVCEGRWQDVPKQELVREGHWELRESYVSAPSTPRPGFEFELHLPFR